MNHQKDFQKIIERYISGKATHEEIKFVEKYYQYLDKADNVLDKKQTLEIMEMEEENLQELLHNIHHPVKRQKHLFIKYATAAAVIFALGIGVLYVGKNQPLKERQKTAIASKKLDILPGKDRAILTLADGSKIVLDELKDGEISENVKLKDGQLIYNMSNVNTKSNLIAYHTIETPKGGQYQVYLPDGTKVWLNAASSLKYPERFTANERKVVLTGEAYFEVAKVTRKSDSPDGSMKRIPFFVETAHQRVEVLGTHFNVNAYGDEQTTKTTLVEGSVKVSNLTNQESNLLSPGQQSILGSHSFLVKNVDTDDETAWKEGLFRFNNTNLKSILYQLERWYDIKIDYENIPNKRYNGMVPRKSKLSEVINMLELTGNINFEINEGRQLKVLTK